MTGSPHKGKIDRVFLGLVIILVIIGVFAFATAGMAVLAEDRSFFFRMLVNQIVLGLIGGGAVAYILQRTDYHIFKKYAWVLLGLGMIVTGLVFVPGVGVEFNGARRWLSLGPFSFQPAELLKIVYIIYLASWFTWIKDKISEWKWGIMPFMAVTGVAGILLLLQPDTGTFLVMIFAGGVMYFISG
ncbi:MAG: FtsW/RodA/SpoVE family cell cycle protein, partial [Candidatus Nomurabacteria bacterium]|nr:FtsW/RodA/SpoVE family cell cycle protein [Candidatus Nomurabacteria bacterium]